MIKGRPVNADGMIFSRQVTASCGRLVRGLTFALDHMRKQDVVLPVDVLVQIGRHFLASQETSDVFRADSGHHSRNLIGLGMLTVAAGCEILRRLGFCSRPATEASSKRCRQLGLDKEVIVHPIGIEVLPCFLVQL